MIDDPTPSPWATFADFVVAICRLAFHLCALGVNKVRYALARYRLRLAIARHARVLEKLRSMQSKVIDEPPREPGEK